MDAAALYAECDAVAQGCPVRIGGPAIRAPIVAQDLADDLSRGSHRMMERKGQSTLQAWTPSKNVVAFPLPYFSRQKEQPASGIPTFISHVLRRLPHESLSGFIGCALQPPSRSNQRWHLPRMGSWRQAMHSRLSRQAGGRTGSECPWHCAIPVAERQSILRE